MELNNRVDASAQSAGAVQRLVAVSEYIAARNSDNSAIETQFLSALRMGNGVSKTTFPGRLDDTASLIAHHARGPRVRVLDAGCSSGICTIELHRALLQAGFEPTTIGSDRVIGGHLLSAIGGTRVLYDSLGEPIQFEHGQTVLRQVGRRWAVRNFLHSPIVTSALVLAAIFARQRFRHSKGAGLGRLMAVPFTTSAIERTPGVSVVQEDLFTPIDLGRFNVIRAANFLNLCYFSDRQIATLASTLAARLEPEGLLLIARTDERTLANHGTLFRLCRGSLTQIAMLGEGSEVSEIIESLRFG